MNPLLVFYTDLLESVGCKVDADYSITYKNKPLSVFVSGQERKLVLPVDSLIRDGNWNDLVAFHPCCESSIKGQSEVLNVLIAVIGQKVLETMFTLIASIVELGLNPEAKDRMTLAQSDLLKLFDAFDPSIEKAFTGIIVKTTGITGKFPFISLRLSRGGEIDGEKYNRVCTIVPHVTMNSWDSGTYCGYKPTSQKATKAIKTMLDLIFPPILKYGTNSSNMPYFIALLEGYHGVATHLNEIIQKLGKYSAVNKIAVSWYDELPNVPTLYKRHLDRSFSGNTGLSAKLKTDPEVVAIPENKEESTSSILSTVTELNESGVPIGLVKLGRGALVETAPQATQPIQPVQQPSGFPANPYPYQAPVQQPVAYTPPPPPYNPAAYPPQGAAGYYPPPPQQPMGYPTNPYPYQAPPPPSPIADMHKVYTTADVQNMHPSSPYYQQQQPMHSHAGYIPNDPTAWPHVGRNVVPNTSPTIVPNTIFGR